MSITIDSSPLYNAMASQASRDLQPIAVDIELTDRCGERCVHCYVDRTRADERPLAFWADVLDQLADLGTLFLVLSGGDALLHRDFEGIYRHAHAKGFAVRLFTNGLLVNERVFALFRECPPLDVQFSLYGDSADLHDRVTRIPGSFDRLMHAMRTTREMGIATTAACSWVSVNCHRYEEIRAFGTAVADEFRGNTMILPARSSRANLDWRMTDEQLARICRIDEEQARSNGAPPAPDSGGEGVPAWEDLCFCGVGRTALRFSPQGLVFPCVDYSIPLGDANTTRVADIWWNSPILKELREYRNRDATQCVTCELRRHCFRCPAQAVNEAGNVRACYPEARRHARLRAEAERATVSPGPALAAQKSPRFGQRSATSGNQKETA